MEINTRFFFFWLHGTACKIFVSSPGIEPASLAVKARSLNHWTTGEVLREVYFHLYTPGWVFMNCIHLGNQHLEREQTTRYRHFRSPSVCACLPSSSNFFLSYFLEMKSCSMYSFVVLFYRM